MGKSIFFFKNKITIIYVTITLILSMPIYCLAQKNPDSIPIVMLAPAISAILTLLITKSGFKTLGLKIKKVRYILLAYVAVIIFCFTVYLFFYKLGFAKLDFDNFIPNDFGNGEINLGTKEKVLFLVFFNLTIGFIPSILLAFCEEIGWRGVLFMDLHQNYGFMRASLISGVIWAVWHLPLIVFGPYHTESIPIVVQVIAFILSATTGSIAYSYFRIKGESIWPAVVMHALYNTLTQNILGLIFVPVGKGYFFLGEFAITDFLFNLIFIAIFFGIIRKLGRKVYRNV